MTLRVMMIGLGQAGGHLAKRVAALPGAELVGGVDPCGEARANFGDCFGVPVEAQIEAGVERYQPRVAVVATPNSLHAEHVRRLVEAGLRHIYCEKPLTTDRGQALEVVRLCERYGVNTGIGFMGDHPGLLQAVETVRSGLLGRVLSVHLHSYRGYGFFGRERVNASGRRSPHSAVAHPERSGGWTIHHACHAVHNLMAIAGTPRSVFGSLRQSDERCASEEIVQAMIEFEGGATGHLLDSLGSYRGLHCAVIGANGTVSFHDDFRKKMGEAFELYTHLEGQDAPSVQVIEHQAVMNDAVSRFLRAIMLGRTFSPNFRDALCNLEVCQAIIASSRAGQVQRLSLDHDASRLNGSGPRAIGEAVIPSRPSHHPQPDPGRRGGQSQGDDHKARSCVTP